MKTIEQSNSFEKSLTVMLVEDNEVARMYTSALLNEMNFHVVYAKTGEEAVAKFNKEISGVLMDLELPGISGCQATRMMRQEHQDDVAIFACSTCDVNCKNDCVQAGMNGYIQKPCSKDALKVFVGEVLRKELNKRDGWLRAV